MQNPKRYQDLFFLLSLLLCFCGFFSSFAWGQTEKEEMEWEDLEVVYVEDDRFPLYSISFYFADGALADKGIGGVSEGVFRLLSAGTRRFSQKDIADHLEFVGVSPEILVFHEFSLYSFGGLAKDVISTTKKICHLFSDATYPLAELKKHKRRRRAILEGLVNRHESLAHRAFREITLQGTPFGRPVGGKKSDLGKLNRRDIRKRLSYFNKKVKKKIYLSGPREILAIRDIILKECHWTGKANFSRRVNYRKKKNLGPRIVLATVPKANQAQIIIGRFLNRGELQDNGLLKLTSEYLGGDGQISRLNHELRNQRGLTYSAHSAIGIQRDYGRALMWTATKNQTVGEVLKTIREEIIEKASQGKIESQDLERTKGKLAGSYPFQFERSMAFLITLIELDHTGKSFREFQRFPKVVKTFSKENVAQKVKEIFDWNQQVVLILGTRRLLKDLKKLGAKVEVVPYKKYL